MKPIYLDNNATTGLDPRVLDAMLPELSSQPSNPSSLHFFGKAREPITSSQRDHRLRLKDQPEEILFTSGGTEGVNMLIRAFLSEGPPGHVITSNVEHFCVFNTLTSLSQKGTRVTFLPAGLWGAVTPEQVEEAIEKESHHHPFRPQIMKPASKSEMGAIPVPARKKRDPLFIDEISLLGKELFTIPQGVSAIAFSGHKIHAPKGTGFIF